MSDLRKAAEAALEALEGIRARHYDEFSWQKGDAAITALRAALEAQQEPVAWQHKCGYLMHQAEAGRYDAEKLRPCGWRPIYAAPQPPAPAPADPHAALDRMAADAERLGLYDEPAEVPLPEPKHHVRVGDGKYRDAYTADQMKQYAAACVAAERDRCAGLCEKRWTAERLQKMRDEGWSTAELSGYEAALESVFNDIGSTGGSDA